MWPLLLPMAMTHRFEGDLVELQVIDYLRLARNKALAKCLKICSIFFSALLIFKINLGNRHERIESKLR